jgi:hypothetical protein
MMILSVRLSSLSLSICVCVAFCVCSLTAADLLWHIFDKNGDGRLDTDEFFEVMKGKQTFGLSKPRDVRIRVMLHHASSVLIHLCFCLSLLHAYSLLRWVSAGSSRA